MALRRSKKKQPEKEEFRLKERLKIEEGMLDKRTLQKLAKLFMLGVVSTFHFRIATGKEADIYVADPGPSIKEADLVVLKIYRIETTSFRNRLDYILGDPRFTSVKKEMHSIVDVWCRKEYGNLKIAQEGGVNAPIPYDYNGNILAMSFVGDEGVPAPHLKEAELKDPEGMLEKIIEQAKRLYEAGLVHADLSEYNVLVKNEEPYFIDFGQAVVKEHPSAKEFLSRDLQNILYFFEKKYNIRKSLDEVLARVVSE